MPSASIFRLRPRRSWPGSGKNSAFETPASGRRLGVPYLMPDPSKLLLLDIFHLALLMLGFGLMAYALIRRSNPFIRWHEHGNVWTDPFIKVDLLVMAIIVGSYYSLIRYATYAEESAAAADMESTEIVMVVLAQIISMTVLIGVSLTTSTGLPGAML